MTEGISNTLRVAKIRDHAKTPVRENADDAGADVFYCPESDRTTRVRLEHNESAVLGTGIKLEVPSGVMVKVEDKSGIASKEGLLVGANVVDSGYEGELYINLHNVSGEARYIDAGQKIAQILVLPVLKPQFEEISEDELYEEVEVDSERGEGGFGSTGLQ